MMLFIVYSLQDKLENNNFQIEPIYESKYLSLNKLVTNEIKFNFMCILINIDINPDQQKNR